MKLHNKSSESVLIDFGLWEEAIWIESYLRIFTLPHCWEVLIEQWTKIRKGSHPVIAAVAGFWSHFHSRLWCNHRRHMTLAYCQPDNHGLLLLMTDPYFLRFCLTTLLSVCLSINWLQSVPSPDCSACQSRNFDRSINGIHSTIIPAIVFILHVWRSQKMI